MEYANFEDLLIKDSSWTIHKNNIHTLLMEIYKSLNPISPHNLLRLPKTNTSRYGTQALCFKESIIWNTVSNQHKNLNSLDEFKKKIKIWKPTTCTCKLCKAC